MTTTTWQTGVAGLWSDAANWTNGVPSEGDAVIIGGIGSAVTNTGTVSNVNIDMTEDGRAAYTDARAAFDNKGTMLANGGTLLMKWGGYGVGVDGQTIYNEGLMASSAGGGLWFNSDGDTSGSNTHYGLLSNSGTVDANGGHVVVGVDVTQAATGVIAIDHGGSVDVGATVKGGLLKLNDGHVIFGQQNGHGDFGRSLAASNFASGVEFDGPGDFLFPQTLTRLDFDPAADTLTVRGILAATNDYPLTTLHLSGSYTADEFAIAPDGRHMAFTPPAPPVVDPPPITTDPPPQVVTPPAAMNFAVLDTGTNTQMDSNGTAYSGPVSGLNWQYLNLTPANINVTSAVPNAFIHSGSGQDAIDVSHANGSNVLDGGTGSNFLVGGAGNDTFFLDDRSPPGALWSTLVNFHSGDNATVWGLTANDFQVQTADNQGAGGFTGLTFNFTRDGQPTASLTFAGRSGADLTSGSLSLAYGHTGDLPGLPGSDYLSIHAA